MNHIYRLCWSRSLRQWIVASELARRRSGNGGSTVRHGVRHVITVLATCAPFLWSGTVYSAGGPIGGQVTAGSATISQSGTKTTIQQGSPTLQLSWQSFNVGAAQSVDFVQPGRSSIAVNRILGSTPSQILGRLSANGQVWLINPNGVLFGPSAQVNVGGIVASTLDLDSGTLNSNNRVFAGNGKGAIVNQGSIVAADGGYVALLGNHVSNQGIVSARLGTIALAGGSAATLTFDGSQLVHIQVSASTLDNLAENRQLLVADGGQVIMTAGAKDALLASAVNNTGKIRAQTVADHDGKIVLLGSMTAGSVNVGGTLDASAPNGGNGGSIETSAAQFNLAPDAHITAAAPSGRAGTWLVDPTDLTIDATAASQISSTLNGGTNVVEQTTASGATGAGVQTPGAGDINVNSAIGWTNASASLTLQALNAINVNAAVTGAGAVTMQAGTGNLTIAAGAAITGGAGVTLATNANFINNAGAAAVSTGTSAAWRIDSTDPRLDTPDGLTPSFIQYNATSSTTPAASGNGFLYSLAPTITLTGLTGSVTKVYDGAPTANLTSANLQTTGLVNGDVVASATGTYATSNAGTDIVVSSPTTFAGVVIHTSTGITAYGYQARGQASADIGTITPAPLTASIVNNPTTVYDGTTSASLTASNYSFTGFVAGQGASVNQASSVAYASADAGTGIAVNAAFTPSNFVANSGTNLANYTLPTAATGPGTITPAPLLISGLIASNKVYDGTRAATLDSTGASLFGVISGDSGQVALQTGGATGTFVSPNVGNHISVVPSGFTLTGAKAGDYEISPPAYLAANITPKTVTITGVTANDKVYDATTTATLNLGSATVSGLVPSDAGTVTLSTLAATGTFSQSDVGNALPVSANGFSLGGPGAGNYTVAGISGLAANITPAPLTITFVGSPTKVYDGSATATLTQSNYTISGFVGGQSAAIGQNSASYATANAGTGITVTAALRPSDFVPAAGTSMSNYTFPGSLSTPTGIITPAPVEVDIINNPTKVFDGTATASLGAGNYQVLGAIPGESIALNPAPATGAYATSNVGYQGVSATLGVGNFQAGANTLLSNYDLPATATGMGTIVKRPINGEVTASITNNPSKTYDGNTIATIPANDFTFSGFIGTDSATVSNTITGQYATKNAGSQAVTASLAQADITPGAGTNLNNYSFPISAYGTGTILPAQLVVTIIGNPTKVYNGDNVARIGSSNLQTTGFVSGEGASITPSAQFSYAQANAGTWAINGSLVPGNYTANSGTLLTNYLLPTMASGPGTITPAPVFILNTFASNKVYDTTTADTLNVSSASLSGVIAGDTGNVTLNTSTTGTFAQSSVGNGIAVAASGFSISGSAAGNYTLQPLTGLTANITPAPLIVNGAVANNKPYDGTTAATINSSNATVSGVLGTDSVTLASGSASGQFPTSNVGTNLQVTASGFTLSGAQAGNYAVSQPSNLLADITPAPLTVTIIGNPVKEYDGTKSVTLGASDFAITGFVGNQSATVTQTASSGYLSPNVGTNVGLGATLEPSDYTSALGTNLSNYNLPTQASGTLGQITARVINLTGTRVYDATTNADASLFSSAGQVSGVNGETLTVSGVGTLSTKDVGRQIPFSNFGTLALGNGTGLAANYTLAGGTDWVTITPAMLTVLNTIALNKTYDGTTTATLQNALLSGVLGSDSVVLGNSATGNFNNKNVGTGKPVSTGMTISGTDAANYTLAQPTGVTADITAALIGVTATGINKQYDGTTAAQVNLASPGLVAGDNVSFSGYTATFSQANVGSNLPVAVIGIGLSGADAGNYTLLNSTANTTANITPRVLNLQGTRVYDTTTNAVSSLFATSGSINGVNGESLTLSGTGTLPSKNVGNQVALSSFGTLALSDGTGLASNYTLTGGTDWVTVTPATLTVANTVAQSKQYDGNTNAQLTGATLQGVLGSDNVVLGADTVGQFNDKNVGTGKPVTTSMTTSGTDAGNYLLVQPAGLTASITTLPIIVVSATGSNKVYDATTTATVALTSANVVPGDNVTFSDSAANFATKNVGTNIGITVSGISVSGADAGNYALQTTSATTSANITPFVLNLQGARVYDSTTSANAALFGSNGVLTGTGGETLTLSGAGTLASKNVNAAQPFATNGLGGFTLTGNSGALSSNYTFAGGTDWVNITPATLGVTGTTVNPKVYDSTTAATLSGASLTGLFAGDAVTLGNDTTGTFADKNVGNGKAVTPSTMTISGNDAGNYVLTQPAGLTGNITPLGITVNATAQNKTYDGTTAATTSVASNGVLPGDTVNFSFTPGNANFATPNAGNGILVTVNGIAASGADVGNYTYNATATTTANILPFVLNLTATRTYDSTASASASLFGNNGVLTGTNGETLTLSGTGTLITKNVGSQIPFTATGLNGSLTGNGGALPGNYTFAGGTDWVTIIPLAITVNASAENRYYNGLTSATAAIIATGVLPGDTVNFAFTGANFATPNAGNGIPVTVNGISATGAAATNYTYNTTATTSANILPYVLGLQGTRVYDGTTGANAALFGNNGVLTGADGETLTLSGSGTLAGKNVNSQQAFAANGIAGFTLSGNNGALASNYTLGNGIGDWVSITPKPISITAIGDNKIYDGTTAAQLASFNVTGLIAGDNVSVGYTGANFITRNVGTNIPITVGLYGDGTDIANYTFGSTVVVTSANITPRALTITAGAQNKTYDATTTALLSGLTVNGLVAGDSATFTAGSANFATPNVGNNISVSVAGIAGTGSDLGNYTYNNTATTSADILPAVLNLTGSRVYDGTNQAGASLFGNGGQLAGVAGQTLTLTGSGTVSSRNVGQQQPFSAGGLSGYTLTGNGSTLASNYTLAGGVDWVSITPLAVTVTATGANKIYDSTRTATVSLASSGILSGDSVSFSAQSSNFVTPNAGNNIPVLVTGIAGSGADVGNYTFNSVATTSAAITPFVVNLTGSRVYDAGTSATASLFGTQGTLEGVNGETLTLSGTGTLSTKNVGNQVAFASGGLGGYALTGNGAALASNYTLLGGVDWVSITPATLTVLGTRTTNRTYDGTVLDALSGDRLSGVLGSDGVALGNDSVGYFKDPSPGINKPVGTAMTINGPDAGNYVLVQPSGLSADIVTPVAPVPSGALANVLAPLGANGVDTPYGTASDSARGHYSGNQMESDQSNQRNVSRSDFQPGLALTVLNGGVHLPAH
ncbi:filamentous hemagglutinin family N-terminal domain-containing protein [Paraburkholderia fungorum]|uniref:Filamentous hemagglutinin family N-terminal domain-containing protein n=1 Tax=Paraburkholderia fungorum TaxID=134537 RepID=A0A1H1I7K6_9BURK|nr:YDG domain-containing protein [Paraburkholderia fungorum]SDR33569.1 filamentous hemagglutinin family N-terminal domain-containing protein [Paraburkholderia fungorum]